MRPWKALLAVLGIALATAGVLVLINSTGLVPAPVRAGVSEASRWGLLIAIAALGLGWL